MNLENTNTCCSDSQGCAVEIEDSPESGFRPGIGVRGLTCNLIAVYLTSVQFIFTVVTVLKIW